MARKQKPEGKKYSYMDTYGDLVTLLMCFFVLLFAMSTVDEVKYNTFVQALTNRFGPQPINLSMVTSSDVTGDDFGEEPPRGDTQSPDPSQPADFTEVQQAIEQHIAENNLQGQVSVEVGQSGATFIRLSDALLYEGNSTVLRPQALDFLEFLGTTLKDIEDRIFQVRFMGHTASIPGSPVNDWDLSAARAAGVASYFERSVEFSPYKLLDMGYGRHYPIGDNSTAEGVAMNRRVDIVVIGSDAQNLAEALMEASAVYFPDDDTQYFEGAPEDLPSHTLDEVPVGSFDINNLTDEDIEALYDAVMNNR